MRTPLHIETFMFFKQTLAVAALAISASTSHAWTLVYANDAAGNVTAGSLQSLRTALNNGASLKVLVTNPVVHVWQVPCSHVSMRLDSTQAVVCLSSTQLRVDGSIGAQFGNPSNPPSSANYSINTLGQYVQVNFQVGSNSIINKTSDNFPMQWYVE